MLALEAAGVEFIPENGGGAGVRLRKVGIHLELRESPPLVLMPPAWISANFLKYLARFRCAAAANMKATHAFVG